VHKNSIMNATNIHCTWTKL